MLKEHNFQVWLEELEDQCARKNSTDEKVKLAFLRQRLYQDQKNRLRAAMAAETIASDKNKKSYSGAKLETEPFKWAIGFIVAEIVRKGKTQMDLEVEAERVKMELAKLKISDFGFNLLKFHNMFHAKVEQISSMGVVMNQEILSMFYQDGVLPHRDLKYLTQDIERRQKKTYFELYEDYKQALERCNLRNNKKKNANGSRNGRDGNAYVTKFNGECHVCGKSGHKAKDCKACAHCKKVGHKEEKCWEKHPELRPTH